MNRQKLIEQARRCLAYGCDGCVYNDCENCKDHVLADTADLLESDGRQIAQMEARLTGGQKEPDQLPEELMDRMTINLTIAELRELLKEGKTC